MGSSQEAASKSNSVRSCLKSISSERDKTIRFKVCPSEWTVSESTARVRCEHWLIGRNVDASRKIFRGNRDLRGCFKSCSGFARLQSPMALSACIDDRTNPPSADFGLRALGLFARALRRSSAAGARADDQLLKHPLRPATGD